MDKNNDALHASLEALVLDSKNELMKQLFEAADSNTPNNGSGLVQFSNLGSSQTRGKLGFISVGNKFRSQLAVLMDKLYSTVRHRVLLGVVT